MDTITYLNIDEVMKNLPGVCWLDSSRILKTTQLEVSLIGSLSLNAELRRVLDLIPPRSSPDPKSFHYYDYQDLHRFLDDQKDIFYESTQHSILIDLAAAVYAAEDLLILDQMHQYMKFQKLTDHETKCEEEGVASSSKTRTHARRRADLDSQHQYSIKQFVESVMFMKSAEVHEAWYIFDRDGDGDKKMPDKQEKDPLSVRHLRAFTLTARASSFSLLCNTETGQSILFDSHPSPDGGFGSRVFSTSNKYGLFSLLHHFFRPHLLSESSTIYVDVAEIILTARDFSIIADKCNPFILLQSSLSAQVEHRQMANQFLLM